METLKDLNNEITVHTHPDKFEWMGSVLSYSRVVGIETEDESIGDLASSTNIQIYRMTNAMKEGLRLTLDRIARRDPINCHLFTRLMSPNYVDEALAHPLNESWYSIDKYAGYREKAKTLGMGTLGVVNLASRGSVHSLIGLGEETRKGVQILSHGAELAIVENEAIVKHYREINPNDDVNLFVVRATESSGLLH